MIFHGDTKDDTELLGHNVYTYRICVWGGTYIRKYLRLLKTQNYDQLAYLLKNYFNDSICYSCIPG